MIIPDEVLPCVGFLGFPKSHDYDVAGTCFVVSRPSKLGSDKAFVYFITAGHVIDEIASRGSDIVAIRLNLKNGQYQWLETKVGQWMRHPDPTVDLAMFYDPLVGLEETTINPLPMMLAVTDAWLRTFGSDIGPGTEVFIVGLFTSHFGRYTNIPIARSGMIAAMPIEKVQALVGGKIEEIDAYLLETRSMGGLSGSPVFAYLGHERRSGGLNLSRRYHLLGVMQGHYDDLDDATVDGVDKLPDIRERKRINKGIGIAIPAQKIKDMIDMVRQEEDAWELKQHVAPDA